MRRRAFLVGCAVTALSCQLFLGLDEPKAERRPDAGGDASADPCKHALPPAEPAEESRGGESKSYWLAAKTVALPLLEDAGVKPGFDLDDSCTGAKDNAPPCNTPGSQPLNRDYDGGVDDALAQLSTTFTFGHFDVTDPVNRKIASGTRTFLIYLGEYNGLANDNDVRVRLISSGGLYDEKGCGDPVEGSVPTVEHSPKWNGCDRWSVGAEALLVGAWPEPTPTGGVTPSWVTNDVLVLPRVDFTLPFYGQVVTAQKAVAVATIVHDADGKIHLEGILAGRLPFAGMSEIVGRTEVDDLKGGRQPLCASNYWSLATGALCSARDTLVNGNEHEGLTCDAVSMTMGFTAYPAQVSKSTSTATQVDVSCDAAVVCPN